MRNGRRRERGNTSVIVALSLPVLIGFLALTIDMGHLWHVRGELQNAADAAALAGALYIDGTESMRDLIRNSAYAIALKHKANKTVVEVPPADIVLGRWDVTARTFTPDTGMPIWRINAVQVTTRRTAATGNAVQLFFAAALGKASQGLTATAIAIGGTPGGACGFPLVVPACSLFKSDGTLKCQERLVFAGSNSDNVGFTIFSSSNPTTPTVTCMIATDLAEYGVACPRAGQCNCTDGCNESSVDDGEIKISNGNNLSHDAVEAINMAVAASGSGGVVVKVPVIDSGDLTSASCSQFQFNRTAPVMGYVSLKILGATDNPDRSIQTEIHCEETENERPSGGGGTGTRATKVYLVQ
jgi:hypothetical protein